MPKLRTGYTYEEKQWFARFYYTDKGGKRHLVKQEAKDANSKAQAEAFLKRLIRESKERGAQVIDNEQVYQEKRWFARFDYTDETGKRRTIRRRAENKTQAKELLRDLLQKHRDHSEQLLDGERMTFAALADYYEKTYLVEPQYVGDRKVAGLWSAYDLRLRLKVLSEFFGKRKLRSITHGELERFKAARLKVPAISGRNTRKTRGKGKPKERQRSVATVHRELSLLRRVLNVAVRNGWLVKNPFDMGDSLIRPGDEKPRERILNREEEARLLAACTGLREHLRAIVICALDTGMRQGELFKLAWSDVDFDNRIITVQAFNTKTLRQRQVAMTERLTREFYALYNLSTKQPDALVFGITTSASNAFDKARRLAGLPDLRFHDLRHTHATRLVAAHIPLSEVGRVLGHTQPVTTYRYVNANVETARRAAAVLDIFNEVAVEPDSVTVN
jgi:integrase